ncbi:MAG: dihydroorotate dehydrogenase-like protein [Myxococcota bacterium]|jgi:dihydroorotate dehydrogenase (fumarate)
MAVDLTTKWLGLTLEHPIFPGASPLVDDLDMVRRLEDAGASCITMHSLFEEQLVAEQMAAHRHMDAWTELNAEAQGWFPATSDFTLGPDAYLEQIRKIRAAVKVPVVGSLNGTTPGGWIEYAKLIEQAGASALELNLYALPSDPAQDAHTIEQEQHFIIRKVKASVKIPVAVKLSPFYSSLPNFARSLESEGIAGLVLFNRLYQPDIDPENLSLERVLHLSDPSELLMRLRWLAILSAKTKLPLAASGGVHETQHVIKSLMAGASAVQVVSEILKNGPRRITAMRDGLKSWLEEHEYDSVKQLVGSMNLERSPDPSGYERANYVKLLQGYHR